jgi:hypothetical protein
MGDLSGYPSPRPQLIRFQGRVTSIHVETEYRSGTSSGEGTKNGQLDVQVGFETIPVSFSMHTGFVNIRRGAHVQVLGEATGWGGNGYPTHVRAHEIACTETGETHTNTGLGLAEIWGIAMFILVIVLFAYTVLMFVFFTNALLGVAITGAIAIGAFAVGRPIIRNLGRDTKKADSMYADLVAPRRMDLSATAKAGGASVYVKSEVKKALDAWDQVKAIRRQDWRGESAKAVIRMHVAIESASRASYMVRNEEELPQDAKFVESVLQAFPEADQEDLNWFNGIRNKVAHGTYEPSVPECNRAFSICSKIMDHLTSS